MDRVSRSFVKIVHLVKFMQFPLDFECCHLNLNEFFFQHEHKCTCCTSQGPDNMALASYLKHRVQLYVVFLWDVIHETVNCVDRALQKSRFDGMVQEILLAWKLPWGPWSSLGFHSKIRAAAKAFSQIARNRCDSFFLWLGEKDTEQHFMTKIRFVCI